MTWQPHISMNYILPQVYVHTAAEGRRGPSYELLLDEIGETLSTHLRDLIPAELLDDSKMVDAFELIIEEGSHRVRLNWKEKVCAGIIAWGAYSGGVGAIKDQITWATTHARQLIEHVLDTHKSLDTIRKERRRSALSRLDAVMQAWQEGKISRNVMEQETTKVLRKLAESEHAAELSGPVRAYLSHQIDDQLLVGRWDQLTIGGSQDGNKRPRLIKRMPDWVDRRRVFQLPLRKPQEMSLVQRD